MLPINNTNEIRNKIRLQDKIQVKEFEGEGNKESDGEEEIGFTNEKEQVKNVNFAFEDEGVQEKGQVLTPFNLENVSDHFDKLIDIDSLQNKEKIVNISLFKRVNHAYPFLEFLLEKEKNSQESLIFLSMKHRKTSKISDEIFSFLESVDDRYTKEHLVIRGVLSDSQPVVFVEYKEEEYKLDEIMRDNRYWWVLSFEIALSRTVCNFPVSKNVTSVFNKNSKLLCLSHKGTPLTVPVALYYGNEYNNISKVVGIGMKRENHEAMLGPFYYFSDYNKAVKDGMWKNKKVEIPTSIQVDEHNRFENGGIIRFAVFYDNMITFLNHHDDEQDDSLILKDLIEKDGENQFLLASRKLRDHDGDWSKEHDCAYVGPVKNPETGKKISKHPIFVVKKFEQQFPISYHRLDRKDFSNEYNASTSYYIQ